MTFTEPEFYFFVGAMLAVGLGLYERRVGSLRAAVGAGRHATRSAS